MQFKYAWQNVKKPILHDMIEIKGTFKIWALTHHAVKESVREFWLDYTQ